MYVLSSNMMTSSNGNIFRVTGPLCGEFTGPGEFPTQRPVTRSFDVSLICARINDWVNKLEAGDLRRHRGHYDVNVMTWRIVFQSLFRWCNAIETWHNPIATAPELHLFCIKQSISLFLLDFGFPHLCRISYDYGLLHQSGRSPKVVALFLQLTLVALL